ncbi:galactose mutarotase [Musca domestica]|uniref:Aldose 1-epimerase n=2 Tax=Musca domestica TaxID=7370 RepID=A0ABM3UX50_MUSDO|nr:galactose mutarotase [Musca domestica]
MVRVIEDTFGTAINPLTKQMEEIKRFTITNGMQMKVQVITLGATIASIEVPDANGHVEDVVLGYDDVAGYQTSTNPYFGATIGRVCNRVGHGRFPLNGQEIQVSRNMNNKHQLHGGFIGFDKVHWQVVAQHQDGVTLQHCSPDGHEGYPGEVTATVKISLTEDNCLHLLMRAKTTKTTAVNMTNHCYFNLAGHAAGKQAIYGHEVMINADKITETDGDSIPTGNFTPVEGTVYDLRKMKNMGEGIKSLLPSPISGYDDNYCADGNYDGNRINVIAKALYPPNGRWLEIASNQPGVQFYTSNGMPDTEKGETPIYGKNGAQYTKHAAFCLETQKYPDAVNHPNFPSIILNPDEEYNHEVIYKFGICRNSGCGKH